MRRTILFKSDEVQLEKIDISIGDCHMTKYRQISKIQTSGNVGSYFGLSGELEVKELKQFPDWYVRELKLQILLDDRD